MTTPLTTRNFPTRFPNGVTNASRLGSTSMLPQLDPTLLINFFDDFHTFAAADWTITETSAAATQALVDGNGGLLRLSSPAVNNFLNALQLTKATFTGAAKKKMWFKTKLTASDADKSAFIAGFFNTTTTPFSATSGIFIQKSSGLTTLVCKSVNNGTATSSAAVGAVVSAVATMLGIFYDGRGEMQFFQDGVKIATLTTNFPDTRALNVGVALSNGEAAAKTLDIDYIFAAKER